MIKLVMSSSSLFIYLSVCDSAVRWRCSNLVPASSNQTALAAGGGCAAAATVDGESRDDNDGQSTTVAVDVKVVMQQQMEFAIKSSLSCLVQPLPNCMND